MSKTKISFFFATILISYFIGALTIKKEWFPYKQYKNRHNSVLATPLIDYHKKDLICDERYDNADSFIQEISNGGFIFYFRHADKFENDSSKQIRSALDSFESITEASFQHPSYDIGHGLSEYGKTQAWILNKILTELNIPFDKIISSPIKRCRQTAEIIFGEKPSETNLLLYDGILNEKEINKIKENQLKFFKSSFSRKSNTAIVAHGFPVLQRIGINANIGQSETLVIKKDSNGDLKVIKWLNLTDWVNILDRKKLI